MKTRIFSFAAACLLAFYGSVPSQGQITSQYVEGLTAMNFPIMDGSDSTEPLRLIIMCKLLGLDYEWCGSPFLQEPNKFMAVGGDYSRCSNEEMEHLLDCMQENNTHQSFVNLLDGKGEIVIAARGISRDEADYAEGLGVTLIEKPIAKDALSFMVNFDNPVRKLTTKQIQDIYTGKLTNWKEVGGNDAPIDPFLRNANSGSQEKFETMVMAGLEIMDFPVYRIGQTMASPYYYIEKEENGIAFTPYYYFKYIAQVNGMKVVAVDGVYMTKDNIENGTYPYVSDVVAAVRSDIDRSSMAYKVFEFLTTPVGQDFVGESGYVTIDDWLAAPVAGVAAPQAVLAVDGRSVSVVSECSPASVEVTDMGGRLVHRASMQGRTAMLPVLPGGVYVVSVSLADGSVLKSKAVIE